MNNDFSRTKWPQVIRSMFTHALQHLAVIGVGDVRNYMVSQSSACAYAGESVVAGIWIAMINFLDDEHIRIAGESMRSIHGSLVDVNDPYNEDDKRSSARATLASEYSHAEDSARRMIERALGVSQNDIVGARDDCSHGVDGAASDFAYTSRQWEEGKLKVHRAFNIAVTAECKRSVNHDAGFYAELWVCAYGIEMRDEIFDSRDFVETATQLAGKCTLTAIAEGRAAVVGGML